MGISLECSSFQLADVRLPEPEIIPEKCDIVNLALGRRGELVQVLLASQVFRLEIDAQGRHFLRPTQRTFAAASDIHAQSVPPGIRNGEYRPGAIGPEMPVMLAGKRDTRMRLAEAYSDRADAVVTKTRELISLEAEDGYLKWLEAHEKVGSSRGAATTARRLARQTREDANQGARIKEGEILSTDILSGQATAAYYEAAFQQVLALAGLERITAGGFNACLSDAPKP
jgi:outer membrane protein TolC